MNSRAAIRSRKSIAYVVLFALMLALTPVTHADSAKSLFKQGQSAEAREDYDAAYEFYHRAWVKDPKNETYKVAWKRLQTEAAFTHIKQGRVLRDSGDYSGAITQFLRAGEIDPSIEMVRQEIEATRRKMAIPQSELALPPANPDLAALESAQGPITLKPISDEPLTLHMANEDSKIVYQTIGRQAGLNVLFDSDYTSKKIQVDLTNVTLYDALRIVGTISGTFWKPITPNTIFVAADTRAKRTALEQEAVRTFYLTNPSQQQDLNDVQTALRNVLGEQGPKFYAVPSQNAIVARGTPDQLLLAEKLIDDLDKSKPEVMVDVAVLEVNRQKERNIGITWPQSFGVTLQASTGSTTSTSTTSTTGTSSTTSTPTLNNLAYLNATNFAITVGTATANLLLTDSDTKTLQDPRIRASDGQKATLKIGSRIPVATGSFQTGAATAVVSSLVNTQFQYIDIGVNVEMTPIVHYDNDVTLKIKIEVLTENGTVNLGGVSEPIIGQRSIEHTIRLREGEASILGGILQKSDTVSISGTPGLGEIPLLKYLFASTDRVTDDDELVFVLIPHVVRGHDLNPLNLRTIDTGTGNTIELRRNPLAAPASLIPASVTTPEGSSISASPATSVLPPSNAIKVPPGTALPGTPPPVNAPPPPAPPPANPPAAAAMTVSPPATAVVTAPPVTAPPPTAAPATAMASAPGAAPDTAKPKPNTQPVSLMLVNPPGPVTVGSTFQLAVSVANGHDVYSVPMQVHYDPSRFTLINVDTGEFLGSDGQAVSMVHSEDGAGGISITATRPQGQKGISGSGNICLLTFAAKQHGDAIFAITQANPEDSAKQPIAADLSQINLQVQ